jgi:Tol biopolymer transport system component
MKSLRSRKIRFVLSVLMIGLVAGSYESAKADLTLGEPTNLGAPVNSSRSEGGPDISADGLSLYFSSDRSGGRGGEDIWVATRPTQHDPWSTPVNLGAPVNSSASESFPCISADGLTLYFSDFFYGSARPGGRGGKDLWMSTRASLEDPWATPVNMGLVVNSSGDDVDPTTTVDGLTLIFASNRGGGGWNYNLYMSTRRSKADEWSTPVKLPPPVSGSSYSGTPGISGDGLALFFTSTRPGGRGQDDMWLTTRATLGGPWAAPVNLGAPINTSVLDAAPDISPDGRTLYWTSARPGGVGGYDLWQASVEPVFDSAWGSGSTAAINDYQFAGSATLTIHGQEKSADLLVTLLAEPQVDADGVQHVVATHTFTFADGSSFITSDQEVATPTATPGLYILTGIMDLASGTGMYEGVTGQLSVDGTIDFAAQPPAARFDMAGAIREDTIGVGATAAINDYQFAGTATLTIHGQKKAADLLVTLLKPPVVDADGVQHVAATHKFTFADGSSFVTSDQEVATPTETEGLYILTGIMDIASGTGMYEGVTGRLGVNGTIDFATQPPAAQFDIAGAVIESTTGSGATGQLQDHV